MFPFFLRKETARFADEFLAGWWMHKGGWLLDIAVNGKFFELFSARRAGQRGLCARLVTRVHLLGTATMVV